MENRDPYLTNDILAEAGDVAGKFDIDDDQARRIAEKATSYDEFVEIWENEDWWL